MKNSKDALFKEIFKFEIDGELKKFNSLQEVGPYYAQKTDNCLSNIMTLNGWDASRNCGKEGNSRSYPPPVTPYQSVVPHITVPSILEFGGLYSQMKKIQESGLPIYSLTNTYLYEDIVEKHTPNLFADLTEKEVLNLFKKTDPRLLGFVGDILPYYHQGRIHIEKNFNAHTSPHMFSGYESNGILAAYNIAVYYDKHPFDNRLIKAMINWSKTKEIPARQELELRLLKETSLRIREGFRLGEINYSKI